MIAKHTIKTEGAVYKFRHKIAEDEVLAIPEKVVLRVEDLITWITVDAEWTWGRLGKCIKQVKEPPDGTQTDDVNPVSLSETSLDFSDVEKEKEQLENDENQLGPSIVILSYPRYCRYRAMMKRLEGVENEYLKYNIVKALGGFSFKFKNTRVMFCRDTFEYPELEGHELLCNHLAPKLKGRPRGRRKKRSVSPGSESNESESSILTSFNVKSKTSCESSSSKSEISIDNQSLRRSTRSSDNSDTKEFMKKLSAFMKMKKTPLGRTPCIGVKEIDLYEFYTKVQKIGGYDAVTSNRLWKTVFDDLSGHQNSTGAATIIRRHYERFLLSYERHIRGEEYKPLPVSERRRLKTQSSINKSESETSEGACTGSGTNTPISCAATSSSTPSPTSFLTPIENKEIKQEGKTSSLRSVRVKPERQKEKFAKVVKMEDITSSTESLEIIKVEMKAIEDNTDNVEELETSEATTVKIEILANTNEPLTTAVTPVQKIGSPKKNSTPIEFKDNTPTIKIRDTTCLKEDELNVPFKPKSEKIEQKIQNPEEMKSELSEVGNSSASTPFVEELKRGKLDILKEGGLEVTPVRTFSSTSLFKDIRPSVIQTMNNSSISSKPSRVEDRMPPPLHLLPNKRLPINIPKSLNISKVAVVSSDSGNVNFAMNNNFSYTTKTPSTPPKVVQSKSIYSYSEKTVYGNPKDCLINNNYPVHTPKPPVNLRKQKGGDLLDLTVTSPQKPIVDISIPNIPHMADSSSSISRNFNKADTLPIFEGRKLGSNLEITLVDSNGQSIQQNPRLNFRHFLQPGNTHMYQSGSKRSISELNNSNPKLLKIEENGKFSKPSTSVKSNYGRDRRYQTDVNVPHPMEAKPSNSKSETNTSHSKASGSNLRGFPPGSTFPHFNPQLYEGNKGISPYFPVIDPLLYSAAMQSLYPQNCINPSSAFQQLSTQEQFKLYSELMSQNSRIAFPFQMPLKDGDSPKKSKKS
ncbi:hypothetical protein WA026_003797 [Henosepilachna vigintioctopunctata]|uniref:ARID domain-containing protein n=1 Tax=Henosepilachna vigintioctopunctata TaxID=420089 RepID=A0AAW1U8M7_9CUCU